MTNFIFATANEKQVWSTKFSREYVRTSGFLPYMGASTNSIIRVDKQLSSEDGAVIHFPYFKKLSGAGVTGGTQLFGSGDTLTNASIGVRVSLRRNSVEMTEAEKFRSELDVMNIAKPALVDWSAERLRDDIIAAAQSIPVVGGTDVSGQPLEDTYVSYANATAAQLNAWLTANPDRILYGNKNANRSSLVHATAINTIDPTQKMSAGVIAMAKTLARKSTPYKITPFKSDATAGRDWFVLFVDSNGYRDLAADPQISAANLQGRPRDVENNPVFQAGDMIYSGVVIREIPEMPVATPANGNATPAQVGHAVLCGIGALAVAYGQMPESRTQVWDYGHQTGTAIREIRGQVKMSVGGVQTGMVSIFHASGNDA